MATVEPSKEDAYQKPKDSVQEKMVYLLGIIARRELASGSGVNDS